MNTNSVLARTPKGIDETRSRTHGLPQRLRTILFLIDGKTPVGQLTTRLTSFADLDACLDALVREGFLAVVAESESVPPTPRMPPAPSVVAAAVPHSSVPHPPVASAPAALLERPAVSDPDFHQAIEGLCRYLHDELGSAADPVSARIRKVTGRAELMAAVKQGQALLVAAAPGVRQGGPMKAAKLQARAQVVVDRWLDAR